MHMLDDGDRFDFIFVAVRSNQMPSALEALRGNVKALCREEMAFLHELSYSATCVGPFF